MASSSSPIECSSSQQIVPSPPPIEKLILFTMQTPAEVAVHVAAESLSPEELVWARIDPTLYERALFVETPQMRALMEAQLAAAAAAASPSALLVEVGAGCGLFLMRASEHFASSVGVDISTAAVKFLNARLQEAALSRAKAIECDATLDLHERVRTLATSDGLALPRRIVVAAVTNTIGILPALKRADCVREMLSVIADSCIAERETSSCMLVFFDAAAFPDAVEWFYKRHAALLCGAFEHVTVSYKECTLMSTRSNYSTKWWHRHEILELLQHVNVCEKYIRIEKVGIAWLVTIPASAVLAKKI